ncbi:hypothetical protein F5883DRAFT_140186 [Diaporthe sp. PMI_573]|nr:hypothetical protein F5883DRAFT_140186 [Diaporthaceae sp. PMI_573]
MMYRLGDIKMPSVLVLVSPMHFSDRQKALHMAFDRFDATQTLVARSPYTKTWAPQQYAERRPHGVGSTSKIIVARNRWRKLANGAPTKKAPGRVEIIVEREYETPISRRSSPKNHAMRETASNVVKTKVCLASWLAPNMHLSRYLRHLRLTLGNASASAFIIQCVISFTVNNVSTLSLISLDMKDTHRCQAVKRLNNWVVAGYCRWGKSTSGIPPQVR